MAPHYYYYFPQRSHNFTSLILSFCSIHYSFSSLKFDDVAIFTNPSLPCYKCLFIGRLISYELAMADSLLIQSTVIITAFRHGIGN